MPLTVSICLYFYLTHTSSTLVLVHPIVSGVWLGPLGWARSLIYHKQGITMRI